MGFAVYFIQTKKFPSLIGKGEGNNKYTSDHILGENRKKFQILYVYLFN